MRAATSTSTRPSVEAEIERPRVGLMRDIVATIQPEQDVIVRADVSRSIAVQGAPGTGKTAVGLHRAAYLLYAHRDQLRRQGVLVVGPQRQLPALHPGRAGRDRGGSVHDRGARRPDAARPQPEVDDPRHRPRRRRHAQGRRAAGRGPRARGSGRTWARRTEGLVLLRGARRFRVATYEVEEVVAGLRSRGVRYGAARAELPQALAHRILVRMELDGDFDDRVQVAVARSSGEGLRRRAVASPSIPPSCCTGCSPSPTPARAADGLLDEGRAAAAALGASQGFPAPPRGRSPTPCSSTRPPT